MERDVGTLLDEAAHRLADHNEIEAAWFLRGVCDGLLGSDTHAKDAGIYANHYRRGFTAAEES